MKKTEEIKKSTVKALEPDIQAILAKGKADLEKANEAAGEERRRLEAQLVKEKDTAIQRLKDDYDRKLVDAREKERAKLMTRLDAADAELQQQLNSQRRRLQEEAEISRNELHAQIRALKVAHAKELDEMKLQEASRLESASQRFQKDKEDLMKKYDSELSTLRGQTSTECENFRTQLAAKLRQEMEKEKQELERQMLISRDAKIEIVIGKLQEESRQMIEMAEEKVKSRWEHERKEWERKLKQTSEIEAVWMEKNRELHDKLSKLDKLREQQRQQNEELSLDLKHTSEKSNDLARLLYEERRQHEAARKELDKRCESLQVQTEYERQQQTVEIVALKEKIESMDETYRAQLKSVQREHEAALANLHERVRTTIARKDHVIENLQEELHLTHVKLEKSHTLIEEQRQQLFGQ